MTSDVQRKLTTILAADAEGYSRVMEADEVRALGALRAARGVFRKFIERHRGRIANTAGDGLIAEFPSVVEAVQCAVEVQNELGARPEDPDSALNFRIGIHLGDVLVDGDDLLGEGVNLAARLQTMAEPGGILISQQVYDQVHSKLAVGFDYLGERRPKNFSGDIPVYRVAIGAGSARAAPRRVAAGRPEGRPEGRGLEIFDRRAHVIRWAKLLGLVWVGLVAINLLAGGKPWVQWPGLAFAALIGLQAAPLFAGRFSARFLRAAVIVAGLVAVNLFSWSGTLWVVWPAAALLALYLLGRLRAGPG